MRIVCHAQHLTGIGHFVRMHLLATGLAESHEVHLVDGGRPVPRKVAPAEPARIHLPPLARRNDGTVEGPFAERAALLADAVRRIRPDAVIVDHYPFGKWELGGEISAAIDAARGVNAGVRAWCSLRDIAPPTRYEGVGDEAYIERVNGLLGEWFDDVLVHSDPAFARIEDHVPGAALISVPVRYTGFVAEPPNPLPPPGATGPWAVVSAGGLEAGSFLAAVAAACELAAPRLPVHVFAGGTFSTNFGAWLSHAAVSVSRAGYNTVAQLLGARVPAVVVPDPRLSDQGPRARRLAEAGVAQVLEGDRQHDVDALAAAVAAALDGPPPAHTFDLDGVAATRCHLEADDIQVEPRESPSL